MCGIVCIINPQRKIDPKEVAERFNFQRKRGVEGFGFSYVSEKGKIITKRFMYESEAFLELAKVKSHAILLHHRRPTSTENLPHQNQPIVRVTEQGTYAMAHNGIIYNDTTLKNADYKDLPFSTLEVRDSDSRNVTPLKFNDSEVLLHSLVERIEDKTPIKAAGAVAFVMMQGDKDGNIKNVYFGRNTNPLFYTKDRDGTIYISSEHRLLQHADMIKSNHVYRLSLNQEVLRCTVTPCELPISTYWKGAASDYKSNYQHGQVWNRITGKYEWPEESRDINTTVAQEQSKILLSSPSTSTNADSGHDRVEAQRTYNEIKRWAIELIQDLSRENLAELDDASKLRALCEIDELVREMNVVSVAAYKRLTVKYEDLIDALSIQRSKLLPPARTSILENVKNIFAAKAPVTGDEAIMVQDIMEASKDNETLRKIEEEIDRQEAETAL